MKIFVVLVLASALALAKYTFTAAEYNMMYHTEQLSTKQFPYVNPALLSFAYRVEKNADVLNKVLADVMCIVEWNGDSLSPYYLDSPDVLLQKLKESLAAKGVVLEESAFANLKGNDKDLGAKLADLEVTVKTKIPEDLAKNTEANKKFEEEFKDRIAGILQAQKIKIFQEPYKKELSLKDEGSFFFNGSPKQSPAPEKEKKPNPNPLTQSVLFVYDSSKFELVGSKEAFMTSLDDKPEESVPYNFVVFRLKPLAKERAEDELLMVICTHFKSKKEGIDFRVALGRELSIFIRNDRQKNPKSDYVLMGDMNAEIEEIAFDLSAQVLRLASQSGDAFAIAPDKIFSPASLQGELDQRIHDSGIQIAGAIAHYFGTLKPFSWSDSQLKKSLEGPLGEIKKAKGYKEKLQAIPKEKPDLWVEASNFPTERKIRVDEIEFESEKFLALMKAIRQARASPEDKDGLKDFGCLDLFDKVQNDHFAKTDLPKDKVLRPKESSKFDPNKLTYEDSSKYLQQIKKAFFTDTISCLAKIMAEDRAKENLAGNKRKEIIQSLLEEEKIDFILLNFSSEFKIEKVEKIENSEESKEFGAPNSVHPSDHFPSRVTIAVGEKDEGFTQALAKLTSSNNEQPIGKNKGRNLNSIV